MLNQKSPERIFQKLITQSITYHLKNHNLAGGWMIFRFWTDLRKTPHPPHLKEKLEIMPRKNGLPPQLVRLVLLTLAIVVGYFVARYYMTPESFGQYGFYRGASLTEHANRPLTFAGQESCRECHQEVLQQVAQFEHNTLGCETCHGPAVDHAMNPDASLIKIDDDSCLRCHRSDPSKPPWLRQIPEDDHYGEGCKECHTPHQPNE